MVLVIVDRLVDEEWLFAWKRMLGGWSEWLAAHCLTAGQKFWTKGCVAGCEVQETEK